MAQSKYTADKLSNIVSMRDKHTQYSPAHMNPDIEYTNTTGGDPEMDAKEYYDITSQHMQAMEDRITRERQQSEDRMEKRYHDVMTAIEKSNERIDKRIDQIMTAVDKANERMDKTMESVRTEMNRAVNFSDSTKKWLIGISATTLFGIAAMVLTVLIAVLKK